MLLCIKNTIRLNKLHYSNIEGKNTKYVRFEIEDRSQRFICKQNKKESRKKNSQKITFRYNVRIDLAL